MRPIFSKGLLRKPVLRYTNADIYNCTVCKQWAPLVQC